MHFHALVLAAVSAGVLSVHLVEKNYLNSKGLPNVSCEGKNAGESDFELNPFRCLSKIEFHDIQPEDLALGGCLAI